MGDPELYGRFERDGEGAVRDSLAAGRYLDEHAALAREWLRRKDQARNEASQALQAATASSAASAAQRAADAAWAQARTARKALIIAIIAFAMSAIAIIVSISGLHLQAADWG
jgi:hypothetical protein